MAKSRVAGLFLLGRIMPIDLDAYFSELYGRLNQGVTPVHRASKLDGDGLGERCHDRADAWCERHSGFTPVRGWVIDYTDGPRVHYVCHSVVRDDQGTLFEITLPWAQPFWPHQGSDDLWADIPHHDRWWPA